MPFTKENVIFELLDNLFLKVFCAINGVTFMSSMNQCYIFMEYISFTLNGVHEKNAQYMFRFSEKKLPICFLYFHVAVYNPLTVFIKKMHNVCLDLTKGNCPFFLLFSHHYVHNPPDLPLNSFNNTPLFFFFEEQGEGALCQEQKFWQSS